MAKEKNQQEERNIGRWRDQHGRVWEAIVDKANSHPVGPVRPKFKAPLIPPQSYVRIQKTDGIADLVVDYTRWLDDLSDTHAGYQARLEDAARKLYPENHREMVKDPPIDLRRAVGAAPNDWEPVARASRGDRWVLGLPDPRTGRPAAKPDWAERFFPEGVERQRPGQKRKGFEIPAEWGEVEQAKDADIGDDEDFTVDVEDFVNLQHLQAASVVRNAPDHQLENIADAEYNRAGGPRLTVLKELEKRGIRPVEAS